MSNIHHVEEKVERYLRQVRAHLTAFTEEETDEILDNLRSHIDSELQKRGGGDPTPEMVEAILQEMDPPESYAADITAAAGEMPAKQRFSRSPIIGAGLLPFGIVMVVMFLMPVASSTAANSPPTLWQWIARFTILPLGILAPFVSTALGLMGISEIRKSRGTVVGLPLAVFVALFYPIIVLDAILFVLVLALFGDTSYWNIIAVVSVLLILGIDFIIVRSTWTAATRPA